MLEYSFKRKGTAIGTKMAPSYAILVLGYLENELYSQVTNKMGEEIAIMVTQTGEGS